MFLLACVHDESEEPQTIKKTDLSKAASYNVQLGLGYLKQNDVPRAKKKLLTALEQEPKSAEVNVALAYYFEKTGDNTEAKKYYLKSIALSGNSGAQLNNYGAFLCRSGDFEQAEIYFLKAAGDFKYLNTAAAYENAALCSLSIPDTKKARLYLTKTLSQDPSRSVALYELIKLEAKEKHFDKAVELIQNHQEMVYNDNVLMQLANEVTERAGRFDLAVAYKNHSKKKDLIPDTTGVNNEHS